jgi:hypothetical protein
MLWQKAPALCHSDDLRESFVSLEVLKFCRNSTIVALSDNPLLTDRAPSARRTVVGQLTVSGWRITS